MDVQLDVAQLQTTLRSIKVAGLLRISLITQKMITLLFIADGAIERSTDIYKALALGPNTVMVGRPQLYALAVAGALGVAHMLRVLREELEVTMAMIGTSSIDDITEDTLYRSDY